MAKLPGYILGFHQFWLSMEYNMRVSISAPGWGSVNLDQFMHHPPKPGYSSREGRGGSLTTVERF